MENVFHTFIRFMEQGGDILWVIFIVALLFVILVIERYWYLKTLFADDVKKYLKEWNNIKNKHDWFAQRKREELISRQKEKIESVKPIMKVLIAILPMLGLLGTVIGMIEVFEVMQMMGTGNARAMASGISKATIPTMAGMVIAVVGLFVLARFDRLMHISMNNFIDKMRIK